MTDKNKVIIITVPFGVGKTMVMKSLIC